MQKTEHYIPALDAVRGLAILLVLFIHIGEIRLPQRIVPGTIQQTCEFLLVGVDLFFGLSGFSITGILYDT